MTYLLAGMLLGVASSVHCAGMCGPLLLAVNRFAGSRRDAGLRMLVYHGARVLTYTTLGVVVGYTGEGLTAAGLGRVIAITSGTLLIAAAAGMAVSRWMSPLSAAWSSITLRAGIAAARLTQRRPLAGYIILGLANALLPCGLLYAAIAASAALGAVSRSVVFMTGFGLGTIPLLMAVTISALSVPASLRRRLRFAGPVVMAVAGSVLIARAILPPDSGTHPHPEPSILSHQH